MRQHKRSNAKEVARRLVDMVIAVPTDEWVTIPQVKAHMDALGYDVHHHTIRRDLLTCAEKFHLVSRIIPGPHGKLEWTRTRRIE